MAKTSIKQDSLSIVHDKAPNKPTITATGAIGGSSPDNSSIIAQLYIEHASIPNIISHPIRADRSIDFDRSDPISRGDVTREIQGTLVLTPEAAISIGSWLVKSGNIALSNRKSGKSGIE